MERLHFLFAAMLLALFIQPAIAGDPPSLANYDTMVVMHIQDLDDASLSALAKTIGAEKDVSMEYSCAWSGVVVLKFTNISVAERADVITFVHRQLTMANVEKAVEFLHVHAEERGPGKC
jgi:hypothetical protein